MNTKTIKKKVLLVAAIGALVLASLPTNTAAAMPYCPRNPGPNDPPVCGPRVCLRKNPPKWCNDY